VAIGIAVYDDRSTSDTAQAGITALTAQAKDGAQQAIKRVKSEAPRNMELLATAVYAGQSVGFAETSMRVGDQAAAFKHLKDAVDKTRRVNNFFACGGDYECQKYK
jgi:hypothetical protein